MPSPQGWSWMELQQVARLESGHTPSRKYPSYWDGGVPWIGIKDARNHHGGRIFETIQTVSQQGLDNSAARLLPVGTVCLSRTASVGYSLVMGESMATSQDFVNWVCSEAIEPEFLMHLFIAEKESLLRFGKGTTHTTIYYPEVKAFHVCLPPKREQRAIVEAIESYFTRLDDAVATLERVQRNLKRYRASVLKAAVEGRLVPAEAELARAEGRDYEPASVLLERTLAERRRRWEDAELAKMKAKGKLPNDGKWKAKYTEALSPDHSELPEIPEGWIWATVDQIAAVKGGITKGQQPRPGERYRTVPYLRVANVQRGFLDLSEIKTIEARTTQIEELRLEPGDVLFNEGGDRDKLGRGWIWREELPECIHQNHVFRARIHTADLLPELLSWYGNTTGQRYFFDEGKQTTNLASINMTKLRGLPVPVPPRAEQQRIRDAVEELLSVADAVLAATSREGVRCTRLRQSILKWAFEGRLVDQDPTDEPASILLERIHAEREVTNGKLGRSPRRPRARSSKA